MELADLTRGMRKNDFLEPEKLIFAKPSFSSFMRAARRKNIFLEPDNLFFLQSHACMKNIFLEPEKKNNFSELEKMFFCKAQFYPVRQYKGSRQKNEPQRGIANLTYKQ